MLVYTSKHTLTHSLTLPPCNTPPHFPPACKCYIHTPCSLHFLGYVDKIYELWREMCRAPQRMQNMCIYIYIYYIYIYMYVYIYICVCMYLCKYVYMCIYFASSFDVVGHLWWTYVHAHIHIYTYTYTHTHAIALCMYVCMYVCHVCMCVCHVCVCMVCMYVYVCTYS